MINLYHYITAAMVILTIASKIKLKCISALSLLVLINFLTYYATQFFNVWNINSAALESIRIAFVMIGCMHFGVKSIKPAPYLCYALVLFGFIFMNGLFLIDPALAPHKLYVALTIMEVVIFIQGMSAVYNAKTDNDTILSSSDNSILDSSRRWDNSHSNDA
jgi:hypothetical protein